MNILVYLITAMMVYYIFWLASLGNDLIVFSIYEWDKKILDGYYKTSEYLKFPLAGVSATPFLFVLAYLLRKTPYPNTLALVFLVIFGHLAAIIIKHWVHYQKEQLHFSVKLVFCLNPYVYLMVSNFYDHAIPFN